MGFLSSFFVLLGRGKRGLANAKCNSSGRKRGAQPARDIDEDKLEIHQCGNVHNSNTVRENNLNHSFSISHANQKNATTKL